MIGQAEPRTGRAVATGGSAQPARVAAEAATAEPGAVAGAALDRFGTDRLGGETLDADRRLAGDQRSRSPQVRLEAGLRADAGRLLANWVVRIANLPVYRARPDLALDQLMDGLPGLIHAVLHAVATHDAELESDPASRAAEAAAEHARRRAAAGFPAVAVQAEFRELHAELLAQIWRLVDEMSSTPDDTAWTPRAAIERLAATVGDLAMAAAEVMSAPPAGWSPAGGISKG